MRCVMNIDVIESTQSVKSFESNSEGYLVSRFAVLVAFNLRLRRLFPLIDLRFFSPGTIVTTFKRSKDKTIELAPSLPEHLSRLRALSFTRVKLRFWEDLMITTTTYTELSADEYENPPDIPTIKINRIRAGEHRLLGLPMEQRLRRSVFGQLMLDANMLQWEASRLRRSYSHIQDAGQKRCFFVKFQSEGNTILYSSYCIVFFILY